MKKIFVGCLLFMTALTVVSAEETAASVILNNFGARSYAQGTIPRADLDKIVSAGVRAPSAGNRQPWRFTVVTDPQLAKKIMNDAPNGNVFIIVSTDSSSRDALFDCALAAENIYLAAQALGYGSRIYASPLNTVNNSLKNELGIQPQCNAVAVIRVGRLAPNVDAVSSASSRKPAGETVTYK
ncbi:MAG: nitroreductase family protein [Spirochaetaceae bacterium]|nr:nitroreductase family protein [Spirochaetaceae bacterium]